MKKIFIFLLFFGSTNLCFSQIDHLKVLIGKPESEVRYYLDSLNGLRSNPYYKIEKDVTDDGSMILKCSYSIYDEDYYTISTIMTVFKRNSNGIEICANQRFWGPVEFAQSHLAFIKDNFKFVSGGRWEKTYGNSLKYKIVATFGRKEGDFPVYIIDYFFEKVE